MYLGPVYFAAGVFSIPIPFAKVLVKWSLLAALAQKKMGHLETLISLDDDSLGLHCLPRFGNVLIMVHCIQIINNGHGSTTGACVPCVYVP